jgi:hypothetical protein
MRCIEVQTLKFCSLRNKISSQNNTIVEGKDSKSSQKSKGDGDKNVFHFQNDFVQESTRLWQILGFCPPFVAWILASYHFLITILCHLFIPVIFKILPNTSWKWHDRQNGMTHTSTCHFTQQVILSST